MRDATFDPSPLRSLRSSVIAGGSVFDLVRRVREFCDVEIAYGLTETGRTVAVTRLGDSHDKRATTVGRPPPGVDVKVVDFVTGALHGPEAVGEIAVHGPNVMLAYARVPAETRRSFTPEGLFLTGDLGIIDEGGYVRVVGRRRETTLRGGYQIYPREVEDQLRAHPAVDDVCVIGIPHASWVSWCALASYRSKVLSLRASRSRISRVRPSPTTRSPISYASSTSSR